MTRDLFTKWLSRFDGDVHKQGRLMVDDCSVHHVPASLTAATLLFLPPKITSKVQLLGLGISSAFKTYYRHHIVKRFLIAVDRPAASLPLQVSLYSAVERVKVVWAEVMATCIQNCFCKAGFIDIGHDAKPEASEEGHSSESCMDEGIVNEVRGKSDLEESDDNSDETLEPTSTSAPVVVGYIDSLRQLVYAKGLGEQHADTLNKLETALTTSALQKQMCIMGFFVRK
ncbi:hypothetical protein HPB50_021427 [Hyalomma asiaticum]|uniref:Uncharacterized protein n=1 Tax=Hyalomma asiaticum TaxID=266040 RepID=A0ACB7TN84_HYAAI|nr:hypothetical protein HPB50_021427 [Hyalomma asiaticum]